MKVLAFDSGATRMGWASVLKHERGYPSYHMSGILHFPRPKDQSFQQYRMDLTAFYTTIDDLFALTEPDRVATEIIPPTGANSNIQLYLANVAITVVHTVAIRKGLEIAQWSANTVKKRIGGKNTATKVNIREGVIKLLPSLAKKRKYWIQMGSKGADETDALAIGLTDLGYKV